MLAASLVLTGCRKGGEPSPVGVRTPSSAGVAQSLPPLPSRTTGSGGPSSPPVVWIGGTLSSVTDRAVRLVEAGGAVVVLQRLGAGATAFYRVETGAWEPVEPPNGRPNEAACAETLMDGATLLALRVFLGATCGPT